MNPRTAVAGLAQWLTCTKVRAPIALSQLSVCRTCPTAQVRRIPGVVTWLSCGEPGEESDKSCGCALGKLRREDAKRIASIPDPEERRQAARGLMLPWGKTRCVAECPQKLWGTEHAEPQRQGSR